MMDLSSCQSPIEQAFGAALETVIGGALDAYGARTKDGLIGAIPGWKAVIGCQINFGWCRADFALLSLAHHSFIEMGWADAAKRVAQNVMIVELDGHNFHERTKAQAARDRSRDRRMIEVGWLPIRFTGSEIYRDATGCAWQLMEIFIERQRQVIEDGFRSYFQWAGAMKRETGAYPKFNQAEGQG